MFAIERSKSQIQHRDIVHDNGSDCLLERSRTLSQGRENVIGHFPRSSNGSSDRPTYKLFPTIESSPPRIVEPRQSPSPGENIKSSTPGLESPPKTLAVRRGRRSSLSLLRSKTPLIQEPTSPALVLSTPLQPVQLPPLVRSKSPGMNAGCDRPSSTNHVSCNVPENSKAEQGCNTGTVQSPPTKTTAAAPVSCPKSPQRGHTRQSSSLSTTTSSIDYPGSPVEMTAVSTTQRLYSPSGIDMRVREVIVAPPTERVRRQQVESMKGPENEACKPQPLFASGSRVKSQPQTIVVPEAFDDREPGIRTPKSAPPIPTLQQQQSSNWPLQPAINIIPPEEQQKEELPTGTPPKTQGVLRQAIYPRTPTPPPSTRRRRVPAEQPNVQDNTVNKGLPDLPTTVASSPRSTAPDPAKVLAAVARQSEALHARYSTLRAQRLKLTKAIAVTLKEMQTQPEYASVLLNQQLSLNATMSSMDICFAKLKSLETQKDQATALINKQQPQSAVPSTGEETRTPIKQDRPMVPATPTPGVCVVPEQPKSESKVFIDRSASERHAQASKPQKDHASVPMPMHPQQGLRNSDARKLAGSYKIPIYDPKQIELRREMDTYKEVVVEVPQAERRASPVRPPPPQTSGSESNSQSSDSDLVMVNRSRQMRIRGVRSAKNLRTTAAAQQIPPAVLPRSPGVFQLREYEYPEVQPPLPEAKNCKTPKPGDKRTKTPHPKGCVAIPPLPTRLQQRFAPPTRPPPPPPPPAKTGRRHVQEDSMASLSTSFSSTGDSSPDDESEAKTPRHSSEEAPMIPAKSPRRPKPSPTVQVLSCEAHEFWEFCEGSFRLSRTMFNPRGYEKYVR